jgi:hypothetical protein
LNKQWSAEWPTKPGYYWFFGYQFKSESNKHLYTVRVVSIADNKRATICEGSFMYKSATGKGYWQEIELPELKELEEFINE